MTGCEDPISRRPQRISKLSDQMMNFPGEVRMSGQATPWIVVFCSSFFEFQPCAASGAETKREVVVLALSYKR